MRITVDRNACGGHGQCAAVAPDLFHLDDGAEGHIEPRRLNPNHSK